MMSFDIQYAEHEFVICLFLFFTIAVAALGSSPSAVRIVAI